MTQSWYPFYWSDYSGKCFHLTQGQHGAYFLFLRFIYTTGNPIPNSDRYSIAQAILDQDKKNADIVLQSFFRKDGELWHNDKAIEIMNEANKKHEKRVRSGRKGGKAKAKQSSSIALLTTPTPTTTSTKVGKKTPLPPVSSSDEEPRGSFEKNGSGVNGGWNVLHQLSPEALAVAKSQARGNDIYYLAQVYNDWVKKEGLPRNVEKAFPAWCDKFTGKQAS